MKILVISDSHGNDANISLALEREPDIDMMIHCGDIEESDYYIRSLSPVGCVIVRGNNDYDPSLEREMELTFGKVKILVTHGHRYRVHTGTDYLKVEARKRGCQAVLYGHTHRPDYDGGYGIIAVNPGSISFPRQADRTPTYAIVTIEGESIFASIKRL